MRFSVRRLIWNFLFRMAAGLVLIVAVNFICILADIPLWVGINPVSWEFPESFCSMELWDMEGKGAFFVQK